MWRTVAIFLVGGIVGTAFDVAVDFFAYPFIFPPPAAMEMQTAEEQVDLVALGRFAQCK